MIRKVVFRPQADEELQSARLTGHLTDTVFRRYDIVSPNDLRIAAERLAGRG